MGDLLVIMARSQKYYISEKAVNPFPDFSKGAV
jgi:hypothetical protein